MKAFRQKIDDRLIISRLQQKELINVKPTMAFDSDYFPLLTKISLKPFIDNLPINVGIDLQIIGNQIIKAEIDRGYFHIGLENMLGNLSLSQAVIAIEHLHMACPIFYQIALIAAYQQLTDSKNNQTSKNAAIAMELARISHHLAVIKNVLFCCNLDRIANLVTQCEHVLKPYVSFSSRVYSVALKQRLVPINLSTINASLTEALIWAEQLALEISLSAVLRARLFKKAFVTLPMAGSMGLSGSYFRANRLPYDLRTQEENPFYDKPPFIVTTEGGDAYSRFSLRMMEIIESLKWLKITLAETTSSQLHHLVIDENFSDLPLVHTSALSEIEGPEGIIKASIFVDGNNNKTIRLRSPAYFIAQAIPQFLSMTKLNDFALLLFSLGITAQELDK